MIEQGQLLVVRDFLLVDHLDLRMKVGWQFGRLLGRRLFERLQSWSCRYGRIRVREWILWQGGVHVLHIGCLCSRVRPIRVPIVSFRGTPNVLAYKILELSSCLLNDTILSF